ncbi:hypothetical protein F5B22DRAFT_609788 [Xylaria bambusicola]|uniref:uncharacterized protein n=1 Tax=Xylaria bambusicola TaxID=326684 RepID=UPI00200880FB|nr:uncharacterized protein F5B22DRAFT_609788 [Xylaria bambusicola]KAI0514825.1 hypothetical protein F5B22DRAFT_609788 [Xylaria bambusicola]
MLALLLLLLLLLLPCPISTPAIFTMQSPSFQCNRGGMRLVCLLTANDVSSRAPCVCLPACLPACLSVCLSALLVVAHILHLPAFDYT